MTKEKPREIAFQILTEAERSHAFIEPTLHNYLQENNLQNIDRRFCQEICYGVVRWRAWLDWIIDRHSQNPNCDIHARILLRMGLYQIFKMEKVPSHAAVHETVSLAKSHKLLRQAGYINALLRTCIRERIAILAQLEGLKASKPEVAYSHPHWLIRQWQSRWTPFQVEQLLDWNNSPPSTFARLNTIRSDRESLERSWTDEQIPFKPLNLDWTSIPFYEIQFSKSLDAMDSFSKGAFYIQDPSTSLAVSLLDPKPGERISDLCSAPGGKTTLIAQCMENQGTIFAQDNDFARLMRVEENAQRLGVSIVQISRYDTIHNPELSIQCDGVLLDAPCSNTGVMRRRVDLRWRIRPEEINRLTQLQGELLDDAAKRVKPKGRLVYSTCSLEPEENEQIVEAFLKNHPHFELITSRQLTPFENKVDGAYAALMIRTE